jgi:uncharacterized low-complexity protein
MQASKIKKTLAIAMGASFAAAVSAAPVTSGDSNPFGMHSLPSGYMQVADKGAAEASCGASKMTAPSKDKNAAEASCGSNQKAMPKNEKSDAASKTTEGKCGEGKCGAGMMKTDNSDSAGTAK